MRGFAARAIFFALALWISGAQAQDYEITLTGGVDSVSVFRGQRSRNLNPSPFAVLEASRGDFVLGAYASPSKIIDEVRPLVIPYVIYSPTIKNYDVQVGARYYTFVDSSDFDFDLDDDGAVDHTGRKGFYESTLQIKRKFQHGELATRALFAPNVFGETGSAFYGAVSGKLFLNERWSLRAHVGISEFGDNRYNQDYWDYAAGVYTNAFGIDVFARYSDAVSLSGSKDRVVVFGFEKTFSLVSSDQSGERRFRKIRNDLHIDKAFLGIGR